MILGILNTGTLLSDEKLIANYKESSNTWYVGELYKRYSNPVTTICFSYFKNREETEDAVMEIFELLLVDLKKYEIAKFKPWLVTVVKHYCIKKKDKNLKERDNFQHAKKNPDHFMELYSELSLDHIDGVSQDDFLQDIESGIGQLKDEQQICVRLFYLDDKSYIDIAEETGYDINKVKSYIQNGKRNLKIYLERANG